MKSRIYFLVALQILIFAVAYFFFFRWIGDDSKSLVAEIISSIFFSTALVILTPKLTNLMLKASRPSVYKFDPNERLVKTFEVYTLVSTLPEKISLKLTNQNLIINYNNKDKVYPISALKSIKVSKFLGKPFYLDLKFDKKNLNLLAENSLQIEQEIKSLTAN